MNGNLNKAQAKFSVSVSLLLFLTALAKIVTLVQQRPFLATYDTVFTAVPIFRTFTIGDSLTIAAILEIGVAILLLLRLRNLSSMLVCALLVAVFSSYRELRHALHAAEPCRC